MAAEKNEGARQGMSEPVRGTSIWSSPHDSVLIRASLIAYNPDLSDLQDVAVTWKEPWAGGR
jgi:hypothetical protein